ncbi:hypothetical protein CR513_02565, partial [Mucuna pruriens]
MIDEKRLNALCHGQLYQKRIKKTFDKKVRPHIFMEGDMVLKKISPNTKDQKGKWMPKYEGPYIVKHAFSGGALILIDAEGHDLKYPINADAILIGEFFDGPVGQSFFALVKFLLPASWRKGTDHQLLFSHHTNQLMICDEFHFLVEGRRDDTCDVNPRFQWPSEFNNKERSEIRVGVLFICSSNSYSLYRISFRNSSASFPFEASTDFEFHGLGRLLIVLHGQEGGYGGSNGFKGRTAIRFFCNNLGSKSRVCHVNGGGNSIPSTETLGAVRGHVFIVLVLTDKSLG